jgi:hypothetical protein
MTTTVPDLGAYWGTELASLRAYRERPVGATYPDWQRTKWQSLRRLVDKTLSHCAAEGTPVRSRLVEAGGARYASFPNVCFTAADIDVLKSVEDEATPAERMRFGFLHYYLLDSRPLTSVTVGR